MQPKLMQRPRKSVPPVLHNESRKVPQEWNNEKNVHNRLWSGHNQSEANLSSFRKKYDVYESNNWLRKISADNKADKKNAQGLPVYKDQETGRSFVNVGDLR